MKTALITGARSGIAQTLARTLAADGWSIALACRDCAGLDPDLGFPITADVSSEPGAQAAVAEARERFGGLPSALINCAGNTLIAPVARTSEAQYRAVLAANLDTAFFAGKAYASALASARQGGALLFFSSVVAGMGVSNHAAVAAANGGVEALTRALAADFAGIGLRVNCIAPGLTRTPMTQRMLGNESSARQISAQYPLGRHGEPDDAAALAAFLVSDRAGWITGQVIGLDGGFSAIRPYLKAG